MRENLQNESENKNISDLSFQRKLESNYLVTSHLSLVTHFSNHKSPVTHFSGRSMTEMLGVLAIIGVLSIGALGAYTAAMNKHRTNRILNDVALAFAEIQTKEEVPEGLLDVGFTPDSDLTINAFRNNEGYDFVQVEGILSKVCENLLQYKNSGNIGLIYGADGTTELTSCFDNQTMIFGMSDTVGSAGTVTPPVTDPCAGVNCGTHGSCSNGTCQCDTNYFGSNCEIYTAPCEEIIATNDCSIEEDVYDENECRTKKAISCSGNTPYCVNNSCYECEYEGQFKLSTGTCEGCGAGSTVLTPYSEQSCYACDNAEYHRFFDSSGYCVSCLQGATKASTEESCNHCDTDCGIYNRCLRFWSSGSCYSCDYGSEVSTTAEQCAQCQNSRYYVPELEKCYPASNCRDRTGDAVGTIVNNRCVPPPYNMMTDNGQYISCGAGGSLGWTLVTPSECLQCNSSNNNWPRFILSNGKCASCNQTQPDTSLECARCNLNWTHSGTNYYINAAWENGRCVNKGSNIASW